ncbi:MAG: hypothetical protein LC737_10295, partial [Chloroflexi bacterium]|nr:hypothetical protein [Chloroflexota bacterium]
ETGVTKVLKFVSLKLATTVLMLVTASFAGVTVSSPSNGSTVGTPAHFVASATSTNPVVAMKIYVDNNIAYSVSAAKIDTYVSMATGKHAIVVQSWDSKGLVSKSSFSVSISGTTSTSTSTTTTTAPTYTDIEQMTGWQSCDSCAGPGGTGPTIPYSITQNVSSPSLDGKSAQFYVGGDTPYSQALWWKQLGGNSAVKNFVYELDFYIKDPNAAQALEFDVNQSTGGLKYIFGTECSYKQTGSPWRIWDPQHATWLNSGATCVKPAAYSWNHLKWEFQRVGSQVRYISVTLNGKTQYINRYYYAKSSSAYEVNVAFQMDKNSASTDYSVWLDNVSLNYW